MSRRAHIVMLILLLGILGTPDPAPGADLTDPMRPPSLDSLDVEGVSPGSADLRNRLTSIVVSEVRRVAVIDGKQLRIGSRIGNARVLDIQPGFVRLLGPSGEYDLTLYQSPVAKHAAELP